MTDSKTKTRQHEHTLIIDAPPQRVWEAITSAQELVNWFPLSAEVYPGPGGCVTYGWGPDMTGDNRITVWDPPRHLQTSWMEATAPDSSTQTERKRLTVDWFIEGRGGKTALRLVHSGFGRNAKWDDEFDATRRGWNFELGSLKHYLEKHAGQPRKAFWLRQPVAMNAEQVWERFTGEGGWIHEGSVKGLGAGDGYRIRVAGGDPLQGVVQIHTPPTDFAGTVTNQNDALFRFGFETCMKDPEAHVWLSTWGMSEAEVGRIESRWREHLTRLFS